MSNFTKLLVTHEIFRILTCVFTILVKFDIHFLGLPCGIFFGVSTNILKIILVQGFCPMEITALFTNMRTLKFKSLLHNCVFRCRQSPRRGRVL